MILGRCLSDTGDSANVVHRLSSAFAQELDIGPLSEQTVAMIPRFARLKAQRIVRKQSGKPESRHMFR